MPRDFTRRERVADWLYIGLQVCSKLAFVVLGVLGYLYQSIFAAFVGVALGFLVGIWIWHSMGNRGWDANEGFFLRMHERAEGSRRGVLEWVIEKIRGNEFSQAKCRAISDAYNEATQQLKLSRIDNERMTILRELDRKVKAISYDRPRGCIINNQRNTCCARCGTQMTIVSGTSMNREFFVKVAQGCFQCKACGRYTCYDCSDNREPCQCGQKQWMESTYIPSRYLSQLES